jgi:hypothetical protein
VTYHTLDPLRHGVGKIAVAPEDDLRGTAGEWGMVRFDPKDQRAIVRAREHDLATLAMSHSIICSPGIARSRPDADAPSLQTGIWRSPVG